MTQILDLDALMDETMDGVEDLPEYVTPPEGIYMLSVKEAGFDRYKAKDTKEEKIRVKFTYTIDETIETDELPVPNNSLFTETFQFNEEGKKYMKKAAKAILNVSSLDGVSLRDIFSSLESTQFKAKIAIRKSESGGKTYENVNIRPIHEEVPA